MHFMDAIAILIARVFTCRMINRLVLVAPVVQSGIDIVLVGKNQTSELNGLFENRLDRLLLDIRQHVQDNFAVALDHAQDRWLFLLQRAASGCALQPSTPTEPSLSAYRFGMSFVPRDNIHLIAFDFAL